MPTNEYLESLLRQAKAHLPDWLYSDLHKVARASAGGQRRNKKPLLANGFEKIAVNQIRPEVLSSLEASELRNLLPRLNDLFLSAKSEGKAIENFVNAAIFVAEELKRRGEKVNENLSVIQEAEALKQGGLHGEINKAPRDVMVVKDFISVVGSAAKNGSNPNDIDILLRSERDDKDNFLISGNAVRLPIRNIFDSEKQDRLHYMNEPQGPHGDNIPIYDLVLRRKDKIATNIVKTYFENPELEKFMEDLPKGHRLDLGCGDSKPEGFIGVDKVLTDGVDFVVDLESGIPAEDESCALVRANHSLEHLSSPDQIMREIHRVLAPEGRAVITVPSTKGEGAFAHPDHKSFWNKSSFAFWTNNELSDDRPRFEAEYIEERKVGDLVYVDTVLKKLVEEDDEILKQLSDEGDTRVGAAEKFWKKNWFKIFPESGKGKFVYQQHWRGLSEDEIGMSEKELLNTDHSIHSDLRFEGKDGQLWGFTIFTGSAAENKKNKGDSFIDLKGEEKLRGQFKLAQPGAWLKVGKPKPLVVEPGGPGAESQSYAKFFALDNGTYEMGTWRQNAVEVFLNGDRINGKIVIQFAPLDGERKWLISRPKGQTPKADETTLETEVKELKEKRQKYLVWAKPGIKPKLIDVPKFKLPEPGQAKIFKIDDEKQIVTGIVHDPYIVDAHGDWIPPNEMEEMAFDFMENSQKIKIGHKKLMEGVRPVESWVERYPTTADYRTAIAGKPHDIYRIKHGEDFVNSGSWLMSIPIKNKKIWQAIKSGEINAFSFGGEGRRMPVARREMPKVRRVIEIDGDKMEVREAK